MFFDFAHRTSYPLLPFSQLVWEMTRWMPTIYTFQQTFVLHNGASKREQVEQALCTAFNNHPVFQSAITFSGRQYPSKNGRQYPSKNILHGKYHNAALWTQGDDLYVKLSFNRILGDGRSIEILAEDFARAYAGLPLEKDDYWGYLASVEQAKQTEHYETSRQWLEQTFSDTTVPVHPTLDKPYLRTILPPKAGVLTDDLTVLREPIRALIDKEYLSLDGFFSLCAALAMMAYNQTDTAALTWAYEGRELPQEQRIFGSLHRDIPFLIKNEELRMKNDHAEYSHSAKDALIRQARNQVRAGIAHSDYPLTLTSPHTKRWNYAVNVIRMPDMNRLKEILPNGFEVLPPATRKHAYALLDIEYYDEQESLRLVYRYSATHYQRESMERFAALIRQNIQWITDTNI